MYGSNSKICELRTPREVERKEGKGGEWKKAKEEREEGEFLR